jgi:hypothetical protein
MKRLLNVLAVLGLILMAYLGSAAVSLNALITAAQNADGAQLLARTNQIWLRQSLVDQVIAAYLKDRVAKQSLTPFQRMAINAVGSTIADELVGKLITADNLSVLLKTGTVQTPTGQAIPGSMSPLVDLNAGRIFDLVGRVDFIKPVELAIRLGRGDDEGAIHLHFENWGWKLSAIRLSPRAVREIISRLPGS